MDKTVVIVIAILIFALAIFFFSQSSASTTGQVASTNAPQIAGQFGGGGCGR